MTSATETITISRPTELVLDGLDAALSRIEKDIEQARQDCRDAGLEFNPISDVFGPLFAAQTWLRGIKTAIHRQGVANDR